MATWCALTLAKKDQLRIIVRSLSDFIWMDGNLSVWIHVGYLSSRLLWVSRRWLFPGQMASIGPSIGLKYGPLVCFWKRETKPAKLLRGDFQAIYDIFKVCRSLK
ncbi:MAG: hypothetical protein OXC92_03805 [Flavobacteriaceae bacterium]|nr:hypothetical protein [Flavobacteriaceae bacterium]